jgi:hypothetical protein
VRCRDGRASERGDEREEGEVEQHREKIRGLIEEVKGGVLCT